MSSQYYRPVAAVPEPARRARTRGSRSPDVPPAPLRIGPYRFRVVDASRAQMRHATQLSESDINLQVIRLHHDLAGTRRVEYLLVEVIRLMHYASGVHYARTEEGYTHSLSTGLIEFMQCNPEAWVWLNGRISHWFKPGTRFERAARGDAAVNVALQPPKTVLVGGKGYRIRALTPAMSKRGNAWGYLDEPNGNVELAHDLRGTHLSVVFLHELVHAFHRAGRTPVTDGDSTRRFARAESRALLAFAVDNPTAWRWLLALAHAEEVHHYEFQDLQALT
jgi:hypothetical protein